MCLVNTLACMIPFVVAHFSPDGFDADTLWALSWILPGFNLGEALLVLAFRPYGASYELAAEQLKVTLPRIAFDQPTLHFRNIGGRLIVFLGQVAIFFALTLLVESLPFWAAETEASDVETTLELGLKVSNLSKEVPTCRGTKSIVKNVSFSVKHGETVALTGESGAGKTTVFKMLAGDVSMSSGSIRFALPDRSAHAQVATKWGYPLSGLRTNVVYLPQSGQFDTDMTPAELVKLVLVFNSLRLPDSDVMRVLEKLQLGSAMDVPCSQLRALDRRKVSLALALCAGAHFLLLDEPMAGLSPAECASLSTVLRELSTRSQRTVIVCTHVPEVIRALGARTLHMRDGELLSLEEG